MFHVLLAENLIGNKWYNGYVSFIVLNIYKFWLDMVVHPKAQHLRGWGGVSRVQDHPELHNNTLSQSLQKQTKKDLQKKYS